MDKNPSEEFIKYFASNFSAYLKHNKDFYFLCKTAYLQGRIDQLKRDEEMVTKTIKGHYSNDKSEICYIP